MNKYFLPLITVIVFLVCGEAQASRTNVQTLNWNGLEIIWLQDERFPTYDMTVYYADGALSDNAENSGLTEMMFSELISGTTQYNQQQLSDSLEFYGVGLSTNVTHEYSALSFGGLVKDIVPTMKLVCHIFKDAVFPKEELEKNKNRIITSFNNLVSQHSGLADHVARQVSLKFSDYAQPTEGSIKTIQNMKSYDLLKKKNYFNRVVKKRLYITGPSEALSIKTVIEKECDWAMGANYVRVNHHNPQQQKLNAQIVFVPVPNANQAQIRLSRILFKDEGTKPDLTELASSYLGGGFSSRLLQVLRVEKGLTYSAGAFAGSQFSYGRAGISTFTKNESLEEMLKTLKEILDVDKINVSEKELEHNKGQLIGSFPFRFESNSSFLSNLMLFDHIKRPYSALDNFKETIAKTTVSELQDQMTQLFHWSKLTIVVVGDLELKKILERFGKVEVVDYKNFL